MAARSKTEACPVEAYARAVVAGEIVAGRLVRLACERHLRDLETGHTRSLRYDRAAVDRVFQFFSFLRLPKDGELDGQPFTLQPFQQFIIGSLFGWKSADGNRRFRTAYVEAGKGCGKSPLAAGIGLYGLLADGEAAAEIYSAATVRPQARILFRDAKRMVEASPALRNRIDIGVDNLAFLPTDSFFRPVSSDDRQQSGPRPHIGLIDEIHEHPNAMMVDKLSAGTKNRRQALIFEITNSGCDRTTVCWAHHEYSDKVLSGILDDDSWFAYVCCLDPCEKHRAEGQVQPCDGCQDCDDWRDEKCWLKANPGLDTILPAKYLRKQVHEAKGMPSKENIVKRLNFCIWTESVTNAIPMDKWDAAADAGPLEELKGRECYGGLDIGATSDFTAYVLLFPHDDAETLDIPADPKEPEGEKYTITRRSYTLLPFFWLPERPVRRDPQMEAVIATWRRQGLVRISGEEVVDYDLVLKQIVDLAEDYPVREIAIDRGFQGSWMCTSLIKHFGDPSVYAFPQGLLSMNGPFRELIELLKLGRLHHHGHPILRWMAANTAAETRGGLIKPSKEKSKEKIDGITAATMALGRGMLHGGDAWYVKGMLRD